MPATRTALAKDISQENREDHPVVKHLQRQVANAFVLYANYKHSHWQTFGPFFRDLHLMFDEFATARARHGRGAGRTHWHDRTGRENEQLKLMRETANVHSTVGARTMQEMIEEADANLLVIIKDLCKRGSVLV